MLHNVPTFASRLARLRIRYLARLIRHGTTDLIDLLVCYFWKTQSTSPSDSWLARVLTDLHEVWRGTTLFRWLPSPILSPRAWHDFIIHNRYEFLEYVDIFLASSCIIPMIFLTNVLLPHHLSDVLSVGTWPTRHRSCMATVLRPTSIVVICLRALASFLYVNAVVSVTTPDFV